MNCPNALEQLIFPYTADVTYFPKVFFNSAFKSNGILLKFLKMSLRELVINEKSLVTYF